MGALAERVRAAQLPSPTRRRMIRLEAGATLAEMAQDLKDSHDVEVSPVTVLRWERADSVPRRDHAIAYRRLLDELQEATRAQTVSESR